MSKFTDLSTLNDDFVLVDEEESVPEADNTSREQIEQIPIVSDANCIPMAASSTVDVRRLDLVFLMDCTGSMGQYIDSAKENIESIVSRIISTESCDVRFGLVAYRDHPPQDVSYVTRSFDFVTNTSEMSVNLHTLSAQGGGDGPEAVTAGLYATKNMAWREEAAKVVVLIADAPPHGIGEAGDGFPEGDPDGLDPLVIAREMSNLGISIYAVGCEPALSSYNNAKALMICLSDITGGKAVCLSSASLLADVILGGAAEELNIQMLAEQLAPEVAAIKKEVALSHAELCVEGVLSPDGEQIVKERLHTRLRGRGVVMTEMRTDGEMKDDVTTPQLRGCIDLAAARRVVKNISLSRHDTPAKYAAHRGDIGATSCRIVRDAEVSEASVHRVFSKMMR
jgi:hypothetical protein